jgi:hypothetical protein
MANWTTGSTNKPMRCIWPIIFRHSTWKSETLLSDAIEKIAVGAFYTGAAAIFISRKRRQNARGASRPDTCGAVDSGQGMRVPHPRMAHRWHSIAATGYSRAARRPRASGARLSGGARKEEP